MEIPVTIWRKVWINRLGREMKIKRMFWHANTFLVLVVLMLIGCQESLAPEIPPKLVINAELKVGYPIDSVFVSWTGDITKFYDEKQQRVRDADVRINGVQLAEYDVVPGVYYYPDPAFRVQSGETYRIEVTAGEEHAASTTRTPAPFHLNPIGVQDGDTVQYIPGDSWFSDAFFTLEWYDYDDARIYRIISLADSATEANFIEDDRDVADVFKGKKEDRTNPAIWWVGDKFARINWMFFNYTGWHSIIVSAMDDNYYQYKQGLNFNQNYGQNFPQVVENGYGLFDSSASDTLRIYLVE